MLGSNVSVIKLSQGGGAASDIRLKPGGSSAPGLAPSVGCEESTGAAYLMHLIEEKKLKV